MALSLTRWWVGTKEVFDFHSSIVARCTRQDEAVWVFVQRGDRMPGGICGGSPGRGKKGLSGRRTLPEEELLEEVLLTD